MSVAFAACSVLGVIAGVLKVVV